MIKIEMARLNYVDIITNTHTHTHKHTLTHKQTQTNTHTHVKRRLLDHLCLPCLHIKSRPNLYSSFWGFKTIPPYVDPGPTRSFVLVNQFSYLFQKISLLL